MYLPQFTVVVRDGIPHGQPLIEVADVRATRVLTMAGMEFRTPAAAIDWVRTRIDKPQSDALWLGWEDGKVVVDIFEYNKYSGTGKLRWTETLS